MTVHVVLQLADRIAKLLGIAQPTVSAYRVGRRHADDEVAAKIAALLDIPAPRVIADLRLERAKAEGVPVHLFAAALEAA